MIIEEREAALAIVRVEPALYRRLERFSSYWGHAVLHPFETVGALQSASLRPDAILFDAEALEEEARFLVRQTEGGGFTPLVALVSKMDSPAALACVEAGAHEVFSYSEVGVALAYRLQSLLEARRLLAVLRNGIEASAVPGYMRSLATTAESVEDRSGGHTVRVANLSADISARLGVEHEEVERLRLAALLHDVGKLTIPSAILKKPARLSEEEFAIVQKHTTDGAAMLDGSTHSVLSTARAIAATHHERWDGSGYPCGFSGKGITLEGRIVAVADVFDALTSDRAYKPAWHVGDALSEIERGAGTQFDPEVVDALIALSKESGFRRSSAVR